MTLMFVHFVQKNLACKSLFLNNLVIYCDTETIFFFFFVTLSPVDVSLILGLIWHTRCVTEGVGAHYYIIG